MGMVYKAEDLKLGRRAALKFLPEELAGDPIALQRLEREAQTASALNHPNICTIYDIEDYLGQPFIAMELLEGETLQQHLAASAPNAIPVLSLIDIATQVCLGLEAAHGKDIVHRDIKPANIFLTKQGPVKLLDFGIAKLVANEAVAEEMSSRMEQEAVLPSLQPNLTRTGATVGTTGYMSPEQIRKEELDGRSDLFSLGMVLYEMATGHRAFTGETEVVVQEAILTKTPPPVETLNREMPASLATVIRKALEKDRSQRYQTATAMRHDLERVRATLLRSNRRRMSRWVPAAAAMLAIAGALTWLSARRATSMTLSADDTIVIAHLTNTTGDRVFDEALYTALRIALEQTPYLNVLADNKVHETLSRHRRRQRCAHHAGRRPSGLPAHWQQDRGRPVNCRRWQSPRPRAQGHRLPVRIDDQPDPERSCEPGWRRRCAGQRRPPTATRTRRAGVLARLRTTHRFRRRRVPHPTHSSC